MLESEVVTAGNSAVCVFDDDNQRLLTDELRQVGENGYTGVLHTLINSALDQGQAGYTELLQLKLMIMQLSRGIDNVLAIVTGFKPLDRAQLLALAQQQPATLSIDSDWLAAQTHPLIPD